MSSMVTVFGKGDESLRALWDKRSKKSGADVTLICIGDYMYCHRKPMIEASPKFKKMLTECPSILNLGVKSHEALFILNVVYGLTFSFPSDLMPRLFSLLNEYVISHPPVHVSVGPLISADAGGASQAVARIAKLINKESLSELNVVKSVNMARNVSGRKFGGARKVSRGGEVESATRSGLVGGNESDVRSTASVKGSQGLNYENDSSGGSVPKLSNKSPVAKKLLQSFTQVAKESLPGSQLNGQLYQELPKKKLNVKATKLKSRSTKASEDKCYETALRMDNSTKRPHKAGRAVGSSSLLHKETADCVPDQSLHKGKIVNISDNGLSKGVMHSFDRFLNYEKGSVNGKTYKEEMKTRFKSKFQFRGHMTKRNLCFFNNGPDSCIWCPLERDNVSGYSWEYGYNSGFSSRRDFTDSIHCSCYDGEFFMKSCFGDHEGGKSIFYDDDLERISGNSSLDLLSGRKNIQRTSKPWYCELFEKEHKLFSFGSAAFGKDVGHLSDPINTTESLVNRTKPVCFGSNIYLPLDMQVSKNISTEIVEGIRTICKQDDWCESRAGKMECCSKEDLDAAISSQELSIARLLADQTQEVKQVAKHSLSLKLGRNSRDTVYLLHEDTSAFERWWKCEGHPGDLSDRKLSKFEYVGGLSMSDDWEMKSSSMVETLLEGLRVR